MKFMKLGTRPDTFYTEAAMRTVVSDIPTDLTIRINNVTYLLHKCFLLPKCGLLQRLVERAGEAPLDLQDIPGGEEAFELCAKYCYGIAINLSANNLVSAFCASKFLRMTELVEAGNLIAKLEAFFSSCILEGWKDSVVALHNAERTYEWSEKLGIIRRCIESIVNKILTPPSKVVWSYTYTRTGYDKKRHQSVPKDWWTEDVSFLDIDSFRCIITAVKSTNMLQPQLIGEALHVYASRWLMDVPETGPNEGSSSQTQGDKKRRILETIVSLIPADKGSVSFKFLLRLLHATNSLGVSPVTKAELVRLSGFHLNEANPHDLLASDSQVLYDIDLVKTVVKSYCRQWTRQAPTGETQAVRSIQKVGKLVDSYLQVAANDPHLPAQKVVSLIETLPVIARPEHNDLYKAINAYLREHPELGKAEKKQICRCLDFQKLSPEVRAHAVKNEHLPLRTVVQVLFFEQEKGSTAATTHRRQASVEQLEDRQQASAGAEMQRQPRSDWRSAPGTSQKPSRVEPSFKVSEDKGKEIS